MNNWSIDDDFLNAIERRIQATWDRFENEEDHEESESRAVESFLNPELPKNNPSPYDAYGGLEQGCR